MSRNIREKIQRLAEWCSVNNLTLKTKELVMDFRRGHRTDLVLLCINEVGVERVQTFTFLGVLVSEDLSWSASTTAYNKYCTF